MRTKTKDGRPEILQEDDRVLCGRLQGGDATALVTLLRRYDYIALSHAKHLATANRLSTDDHDDLYQVATITMLRVIPDFDPKRDATMATFLSTCIRRDLIRAVNNILKRRKTEVCVSDSIPGNTNAELETVAGYDPAADTIARLAAFLLNERELTALVMRSRGIPFAEIARDRTELNRKQWRTVFNKAVKKLYVLFHALAGLYPESTYKHFRGFSINKEPSK